MGIGTATVMNGGTIGVTGGTSKAFAASGAIITAGFQVADFAITDFRIRPTITFKRRQPVQNKTTGRWKKGKSELVLTMPFLRADNLTVEYPLFRLEIEDHPEMTQANLLLGANWLSQLIMRTEIQDFVKYGSLQP